LNKLKAVGWEMATYESEDKELWGNQGYIMGAPARKKKTRIVKKKVEKQLPQPQMLKEKELEEFRAEIKETLREIEIEKEKRQKLRASLHLVESQLAAYQEQFETKGGKTYTVKKGDSLWKVARKEYGDGCKWPLIYKANQNKIKNPNMIYPGQKIHIPRIRVKK